MEHAEVEDKSPIHKLFRDVVVNGFSFGAERWFATLQRTCERFACLMVSGNSARDLGGGKSVLFVSEHRIVLIE